MELAAYCGDEAAREAIGPRVVKRRNGLTCCCGSDEETAEHGYYGVEGYTHNFTHACDYAEVECGCDFTEVDEEWWPTRPPAALAPWLSGLSRWGPHVLVRAAVAAARVALPVWAERECGEGHNPDLSICQLAQPPLRAIEAAEAWLACPCEEHRWKWADAWAGGTDWFSAPEWLPGTIQGAGESIQDAAHLAGEPAVRAAICTALIEWAAV